jgi:hypothetical protein
MFKGHYKSLRGKSKKFKNVESWMKYVRSKFFPSCVVTLWSTANEWDDFDHNHTKYGPQLVYEPQLVYHEPQLVKFEIRVNHNLEPRRPNKVYKDRSENLNGHPTCVNPFLGGKTKSQLGRFVGTISRTL